MVVYLKLDVGIVGIWNYKSHAGNKSFIYLKVREFEILFVADHDIRHMHLGLHVIKVGLLV